MSRYEPLCFKSRLCIIGKNTGNSMAVRLLLLCLTGLALSEEPPDVNCWVVNLDYVHCEWNGSAAPDVNYTFYSRFDKGFSECAKYVLENTTVVGCDHPYEKLLTKRFILFTTRLVLVNQSFDQTHELKPKVKLNAPVHLSVKQGSDGNLWFNWNYTYGSSCIVSEVRHRVQGKQWRNTRVQKQSYCINLPSSSYRYELQVRSSIDDACGPSDFWSAWSQPVFWGSMRESNSTGTSWLSDTKWTSVFCALGAVVLVLLLVMLLVQHERLKVILIPILPNPGKNLTKILVDGNLEDWLPICRSLTEGLKVNYMERACSVREYSRVPRSASESSADRSCSDLSSGSCGSSVATDSTNCSASLPVNQPAGSASCPSTAE